MVVRLPPALLPPVVDGGLGAAPVTVTSVPTPYRPLRTPAWAFLTPAEAAVTVSTSPTPTARPSAMKIACRMRRRNSRARYVKKNMPSFLGRRRLRAGDTSCNRGATGTAEGLPRGGEALMPEEHDERAAHGERGDFDDFDDFDDEEFDDYGEPDDFDDLDDDDDDDGPGPHWPAPGFP